jgi:hypothetical protein
LKRSKRHTLEARGSLALPGDLSVPSGAGHQL